MPVTDPVVKMPDLNFGDFEYNFKWLLSTYVKDITDPKFVQEVSDLAKDSIKVTALKLKGADAELVERAKAAITARAQTMAGIPGLVTAANAPTFINYVTGIANMLIDYGVAAVTGYMGHLALSGMALVPKNQA